MAFTNHDALYTKAANQADRLNSALERYSRASGVGLFYDPRRWARRQDLIYALERAAYVEANLRTVAA